MCIVFLWISSYRIAFHFNNTGQNLLTITLRNLSHSCLPDEDIHTSKTFQSIKIKITFHLPPAYISFLFLFPPPRRLPPPPSTSHLQTHIFITFFSSLLLYCSKKKRSSPCCYIGGCVPPLTFLSFASPSSTTVHISVPYTARYLWQCTITIIQSNNFPAELRVVAWGAFVSSFTCSRRLKEINFRCTQQFSYIFLKFLLFCVFILPSLVRLQPLKELVVSCMLKL